MPRTLRGPPPYGTRRCPALTRPARTARSTRGRLRGRSRTSRKTETTLTTRIRINIPGSRPIPPVVMRTTGERRRRSRRVRWRRANGGAQEGFRSQGRRDRPGRGAGRRCALASRGGPHPCRSAPRCPLPWDLAVSRRRPARPVPPASRRPPRRRRAPGAVRARRTRPGRASSPSETSDWFAPRKSPKSGSGASSGATPPPAPSGGASGAGGPGRRAGRPAVLHRAAPGRAAPALGHRRPGRAARGPTPSPARVRRARCRSPARAAPRTRPPRAFRCSTPRWA